MVTEIPAGAGGCSQGHLVEGEKQVRAFRSLARDHGGINHCRLLPAGSAGAALCPGPAPAGIQLVMVRRCHSCPAIPDCSQSKQRRDGLCDPAVPSAATQREALPARPLELVCQLRAGMQKSRDFFTPVQLPQFFILNLFLIIDPWNAANPCPRGI